MEDLAYAAGLFDGEGTVTLSKQKASAKFRTPTVSVSSTTLSLLEFLKELFGGSIVAQKVYQDHHKQSWSWKLDYNRALNFLCQILPFMREPDKIRRAKLLLEVYPSITPRNGKYTEEMIQSKLEFEHEFFHPSTS